MRPRSMAELPRDLPVPDDPSDIFVIEANEAFRNIVMGLSAEDEDLVNGLVERFTTTYRDPKHTPFSALARVGIVHNGVILRMMTGDPNPSGPPTREIRTTTVIVNLMGDDRDTSMEELATTAVTYAANWYWAKLDKFMKEMEGKGDDFMEQFSQTLIAMFLAIGGEKMWTSGKG